MAHKGKRRNSRKPTPPPTRPKAPHRVSREELNAKAATRAELEPMKVAHMATLLLADMLYGLHQPPELTDTPEGKQQAALGLLSAMMMRTARLCLLGVSTGYVPETLPLKRRLTEIAWRTELVLRDASGEYASRWLYGPTPSVGKLPHKIGPNARDVWETYSIGTHADRRIIPASILQDVDGKQQLDVHVTAKRDRDLAHMILIESAMETHDQAAKVAEHLRADPLSDDLGRKLERVGREITEQFAKWYPDGAAMQAVGQVEP
jgi:hypothetical protein